MNGRCSTHGPSARPQQMRRATHIDRPHQRSPGALWQRSDHGRSPRADAHASELPGPTRSRWQCPGPTNGPRVTIQPRRAAALVPGADDGDCFDTGWN